MSGSSRMPLNLRAWLPRENGLGMRSVLMPRLEPPGMALSHRADERVDEGARAGGRGGANTNAVLFQLGNLFYAPSAAKSPSASTTYVGTATAPSFSNSARPSIPASEGEREGEAQGQQRVESSRSSRARRRTGEHHERVDAALVAERNVRVETVADHDHARLVELVAASGARSVSSEFLTSAEGEEARRTSARCSRAWEPRACRRRAGRDRGRT